MRVGGELKDRVPPGLTGERHIFISRTAGLGPKGWTEVLQTDRWAGEMCGLRAPHSGRHTKKNWVPGGEEMHHWGWNEG